MTAPMNMNTRKDQVGDKIINRIGEAVNDLDGAYKEGREMLGMDVYQDEYGQSKSGYDAKAFNSLIKSMRDTVTIVGDKEVTDKEADPVKLAIPVKKEGE